MTRFKLFIGSIFQTEWLCYFKTVNFDIVYAMNISPNSVALRKNTMKLLLPTFFTKTLPQTLTDRFFNRGVLMGIMGQHIYC